MAVATPARMMSEWAGRNPQALGAISVLVLRPKGKGGRCGFAKHTLTFLVRRGRAATWLLHSPVFRVRRFLPVPGIWHGIRTSETTCCASRCHQCSALGRSPCC